MLEICAADLDSVSAALKGGADRIELCTALESGGLTPSMALINRSIWKASSRAEATPVHVLLRPRPGDFFYTDRELDIICEDAVYAIEAGAAGLVFGALAPDGTVDDYACSMLMQTIAKTLRPGQKISTTFHRAFDFCKDPVEAMHVIASLGFDRILTSGQAADAMAGCDMLSQLVSEAPENLSIMAGGGINPENVRALMEKTGVREVHASAKKVVASRMKFRRPDVNTGSGGNDDYRRQVTDADIVAAIKENMPC